MCRVNWGSPLDWLVCEGDFLLFFFFFFGGGVGGVFFFVVLGFGLFGLFIIIK